MSDRDTARETMGPDSHRDPEAWCSEREHYRPERPRSGVPDGDITGPNGRGLAFPEGRTLQAQIPSTASDGLAPSASDPSLEYSTDNAVLFWQPGPIFRSGRLRRLSTTACHILARSSL